MAGLYSQDNITVIYITMYKYTHITHMVREQDPIFVVLKASLASCGPYTSSEESPQTSNITPMPCCKSFPECQTLSCLYTVDTLCDG